MRPKGYYGAQLKSDGSDLLVKLETIRFLGENENRAKLQLLAGETLVFWDGVDWTL